MARTKHRPGAESVDHPSCEAPGETLWAETTDGLRLAIEHVGPASGEAVGDPVLLLHGLSANRYAFHFPNRSLASHLAGCGFDCYVPELRGAGRSDTPVSPWGLDDYTRLDLPAIIAAVLAASGRERLAWVGHSLGGVLLFLYAIENPDAPIARGVTIGSSLDYRAGHSDFEELLVLRALFERLPAIPWGTVTRWLAPLVGRVRTPLETFNVWPTNIEAGILRRIFTHGFETIPMPLLRDLATTYDPGGIRDRAGTIHYLERVGDVELPILLLGGSRDVQCPAAAVVNTAQLLRAGEVALFGRDHGHLDEYGHFDLLLGRRAERETWPSIVAALGGQGFGQRLVLPHPVGTHALGVRTPKGTRS